MSKHRSNEVLRKSDTAIQRETALKWAARAVACYRKYAKTRHPAWLARARSYADEALEHAALTRDGGRLVGKIERDLLLHAHKAFAA